MIPPTIACARAMRDAGIDMIAALDFGLLSALEGLPVEQARELSLTFRTIMAEAVVELINPAVHAFPELDPDESTWGAIVKERAEVRSRPQT